MKTDTVSFQLNLMLAIHRAQQSGHLAFARALVEMLRVDLRMVNSP